jgi:hypothetical protein
MCTSWIMHLDFRSSRSYALSSGICGMSKVPNGDEMTLRVDQHDKLSNSRSPILPYRAKLTVMTRYDRSLKRGWWRRNFGLFARRTPACRQTATVIFCSRVEKISTLIITTLICSYLVLLTAPLVSLVICHCSSRHCFDFPIERYLDRSS